MLSWIGRGVVVLLVLALASAAAMTSPDPASAQTEAPPYESLRSGNTGYLDDFYKKVLHDSERSSSWHNQVTGSNAGKNVIYKQATKARIAARLLPAFGTFATRATLVGSGAYLGWTIYQNFSGTDDDEVDMWLDHPALASDLGPRREPLLQVLGLGDRAPDPLGRVGEPALEADPDPVALELDQFPVSSLVGSCSHRASSSRCLSRASRRSPQSFRYGSSHSATSCSGSGRTP